MNSIDEKLQNFTKMVMKEAAEKRIEIIKNAQEDKNNKTEETENKLLENAYNEIQKVIRRVMKEKNEKLSKAIIESKKSLFIKRQKVIDELFGDIKIRINEIKKTDKYLEFLKERALLCYEQAGDGEKVIYIDKSDEDNHDFILKSINEKYKEEVEVKVDEENILGGCKVLNKDKNILIDYSLESKVMEEKEEFLKTSGLIIK